MGERIVVLGGTRSGKSAVAERLAAARGGVVYVATGAAGDEELRERIAAHRRRRPEAWTTVETADVGAALRAAPTDACVLVENLAGWLAERFAAHDLWPQGDEPVAALGEQGRSAAAAVVAEAEELWAQAARRPGATIVVADESGLGVIPADAASRRWLDIAGEVVQRLVADADAAYLVVAGRPLALGGRARAGAAATLDHPVAQPAPLPQLRVHGDAMTEPGLVDFAVNVHHGPLSAAVRAALATALDDPGAYPDPARARAAVAARHERPVDEVLVTAGAAEAFWLLAAAVNARHAVCVHPSFTEPEAALRAHGIAVSHVLRRAEDAWALDPAAVPADADLVVVGNPNNPTGTLDAAETVARLCRPGRLTVVDEAFMDFTPDEAASLSARRDLPGLVVTRSVTKLWGLAGMRAGYLLGPPGLVARCAALRQPWAVAGPALAALAACSTDEAHRRAVAEQVAVCRSRFALRLAALPGVTVWEGAANFVLVRVADGPGAAAGLRERGFAVRTSTFPGLETDHLRLAVRADAENDRLVAALAQTLGQTLAHDPAAPAAHTPAHPPAHPPTPIRTEQR